MGLNSLYAAYGPGDYWYMLVVNETPNLLRFRGGAGADLDRVDWVPEPCQRFQIYKITGLWDLKTAKLIYFLGDWNPVTVLMTGFQNKTDSDWNPVTVLMTGFQNKTDSLSFFVGQLGCFIDLKINAGSKTKRCESVGVTPAAGVITSLPNKIIMWTALQSQMAVSTYL